MSWKISIDIAEHLRQARIKHQRTLEYLGQALCSHLEVEPEGAELRELILEDAGLSNRDAIRKWLDYRFSLERAFDTYPWPTIEEFAQELSSILETHQRIKVRGPRRASIGNAAFGPGSGNSHASQARNRYLLLALTICRHLNIMPYECSLAPYFDEQRHCSNRQTIANWLTLRMNEADAKPAETKLDQWAEQFSVELKRRLPPHVQGDL